MIVKERVSLELKPAVRVERKHTAGAASSVL